MSISLQLEPCEPNPFDSSLLNYDTVEDFSGWISENLAGILSNDSPFDSGIEAPEAQLLLEALYHSESVVDGYLSGGGYLTPVNGVTFPRTVSIIRMYVRDIATHKLFTRRGLTKERYYKYNETIRELDAYANRRKHFPEKIPTTSAGKMTYGSSFESRLSSKDASSMRKI